MGHQRTSTEIAGEDRDLRDTDPAKLLPFTCVLERSTGHVERLPKQYIGSDKVVYGDVVQ